MKRYILALDQGTTSSRAILFSHDAQIVGVEQKETRQYFNSGGIVEQDPLEIAQNQIDVATTLLQNNKVRPEQINAIGITNQRETTVVWDKFSGKPVYNAIIWQDRRTSAFCDELKNDADKLRIISKTGLKADPYFSASKLLWILDNVRNAREKAERGELLFGTIDTWLIWNLSGGKLHITDTSNASRTMLFNIETRTWDEELLKLFRIPAIMLPEIRNSSEVYGSTHERVFGKSIPVASAAGDQQAALFGQRCIREGLAKNTYGTGCFMLMNTGDKIVRSSSGLLSTIAWTIDGKTEYALEGSVFIAGAAIKWLKDNLGIINSVKDTSQISIETNGNNNVYFVPAFSGLGAPYWNPEARGIITGLSLDTNKAHIVRACLESLAYQTRDVFNAMEKDSGVKLLSLKVDGGASANEFLMQFQADILGVEVERPEIIESTAFGAALLAGLATGFWTDKFLTRIQSSEQIYKPLITSEKREDLYNKWVNAVNIANKY